MDSNTPTADEPPSPRRYSGFTYKTLDTSYSYTTYKPPDANYPYVAYRPPTDTNCSDAAQKTPVDAVRSDTGFRSSDVNTSYIAYKPSSTNNQYIPYRPGNRLSSLPETLLLSERPRPAQLQSHSTNSSEPGEQGATTEFPNTQSRPHLRIETSNVYLPKQSSGGIYEIPLGHTGNPTSFHNRTSSLPITVSSTERRIPPNNPTRSHEREPENMGIIHSHTTPIGQGVYRMSNPNRYSYGTEPLRPALMKSNTTPSFHPTSGARNSRIPHRRVASEANLFMGDTGGDDSSDDPDELEGSAMGPYQGLSHPSAVPCSGRRGPEGEIAPLSSKKKPQLTIKTPYIVPNSGIPGGLNTPSDLGSPAPWEPEYAALMRILVDRGGPENYQPQREYHDTRLVEQQGHEVIATPATAPSNGSRPQLPTGQSRVYMPDPRLAPGPVLALDLDPKPITTSKPSKGRVSGFFARILP